MDIQQVAPWASLLASILTFVYVGYEEWRRTPRNDDSRRSRPSVADIVSSADVFLLVTVTMLFLAGLTHYVLLLTPATVLITPVWLLALFVIAATGLIQTMPGETFEEKVERFTERLVPDENADVDTSDAGGDTARTDPTGPEE